MIPDDPWSFISQAKYILVSKTYLYLNFNVVAMLSLDLMLPVLAIAFLCPLVLMLVNSQKELSPYAEAPSCTLYKSGSLNK